MYESAQGSPQKRRVASKLARATINYDNFSTLKNARTSLLGGAIWRVNKDAKKELREYAIANGSSKTKCVSEGARANAELNGRKTVVLRDVLGAIRAMQ